jgi:hypothetical protein
MEKLNFTATMYKVHSGNISRVGWQFFVQENIGVMQVEFNNGQTYRYGNVTKEKNGEFWASESRGKWFSENIKKDIFIKYIKIENE